MNYHGNKSLNKGIIESKSSYLISDNFFKADFEKKIEKRYDFFNSKMNSEAEFAKKFINDVVSICVNPDLLKKRNESNFNLLPESVKKAETYLNQIKVGAYSCSKGIESVRKNIAQKLSDRDKFKTEPDDIFLVYGGMDAYQHILSLFSKNDSVIILIIFF
jgi:aspartate/methionine/tyrosine aminotransferase